MDAGRPLDGEIALVTGASRGLGAAISRALAAQGANIALVARPSDDLDATTAALQDGGYKAAAFPADLRDPTIATEVVKAVTAEIGPPTILINNAALQSFAPILEMRVQTFVDSTMVELAAPFAFTQAVLPAMIDRKSGTIINIASDLAYRAVANGGVYCATKRALVALSEVTGLEHRENGIRVVVIQPGWIATAPDPEPGLQAGRMSVQQVADAVIWCCLQPPMLRIDSLTIHPMVQP
ncbi:SDR family NAD(P)-dependent oxidoreductase [Mesorhizobium sp. M1348]|uniref:SDR family oxidoreductase n=1 Tax=Mesorhizobium sp. M1348 TaxID=2957089 RepID=UPI00333C09A2